MDRRPNSIRQSGMQSGIGSRLPPGARPKRSRRLPALLLGLSAVVAACATDADTLVVSQRADQIPDVVAGDPTDPTGTTVPGEPDDPTVTTTTTTTTTSVPGRNEPITPVDPMIDPDTQPDMPEIDPTMIDPDAIDFGDNKPPQPWDDFLSVALADVEDWLTVEFEPAFGIPFEPLEGGIFAAYPERTSPIPGCGRPNSTFEDIQAGGAIYCFLGDFIAYDDTPEGVVGSLASTFGPVTFGLVLAHEYGHALQDRVGTLQRSDLDTVDLEQQADCVAGAWAGRANAGDAPGITFDDTDVRAGLISMISIEDPRGTDPTAPGGHGSGFDRVGAFQVGFQEGLTRCATLIDDPLPLTPILFTEADLETNGNAPFGFGDAELFGFLVPDLNLLYDNDLQTQFPDFRQLDLVAVQSESEVVCDAPTGYFDLGVELCSENDTVYLNEPIARSLYDRFGDFGPAYLIGIAWAEHAQNTAGSALTGEERQLQNDCLTGAWVNTVIPDPVTGQLPEPRDPDRAASVSAGDLTEAILTAIVVGDPEVNTNVLGSPFEKIDSFRRGTLDGITTCA
ncbi:MAG: neutral zinc metallopeptidase [Ilumatobacter sp.]|uniref:neutral zinc metallopeptidase n=1 Tax=Ilumatobacter sp. TaxID=1967498 RepID=UPI003297E182